MKAYAICDAVQHCQRVHQLQRCSKSILEDTDRASCLSLAVTQIDSPSQEEVDEVHQRFKVALKELFDSHKHLMPGWHAKELLIV